MLPGGNGQIGLELQRNLPVLGDIVALGSSQGPTYGNLGGDLGNLTGLASVVYRVATDTIAAASAYTEVDSAGSQPESTLASNAEAAELLALEAAPIAAVLMHRSTLDAWHISGINTWRENYAGARSSACGHLMRARKSAEAQYRRQVDSRASWVCATRGGNCAKAMRRVAAERETLSVINKQLGLPTSANLHTDSGLHAFKLQMSTSRGPGAAAAWLGGSSGWCDYPPFAPTQSWPVQVLSTLTADYPRTTSGHSIRCSTRSAFEALCPYTCQIGKQESSGCCETR